MQWKKCFESSSFNDLSLIDVLKSSNPIKDECKREMTRQNDKGLSFGNMAVRVGHSKSNIGNYCLARR
ncbi:hypothetical protein B6S12_00030 [Helicobacter valdiviensis]|uniref:Transposase n=1 Tax=Helicobacter valdiviensis TaxID=1458358 RepID=A0A2W6MYB1_9HELI|nr:hypothetical protein [Helicobacter valdiviensis]PZT49021.1 hypothetical protein B6S12_00030 [Helicobacter valdiviensis]